MWGHILISIRLWPWASQVVLVLKNLPANAGDIRDTGSSVGREDPLEEVMATHFSILAWRIPWTEEPGGLQFIGLQRIGHDWSNLAHICMDYEFMEDSHLHHIKFNLWSTVLNCTKLLIFECVWPIKFYIWFNPLEVYSYMTIATRTLLEFFPI